MKTDIRNTASQFNTRNRWGINAAHDLAIEVLTDCNAHSEVRAINSIPEILSLLENIASNLGDKKRNAKMARAILDHINPPASL